MDENLNKDEPLDEAAEMTARGARAVGQIEKLSQFIQEAHLASGTQTAGGMVNSLSKGAAISGPTGLLLSVAVSVLSWWKLIVFLVLIVILWGFVIVHSFELVLGSLGYTDADQYVEEARVAEYQNTKAKIDSLFLQDTSLKAEILSLIEASRNVAREEIQSDYEEGWSGYDEYSIVFDECEDYLKPYLSQYLAVLIEENWNGDQIVLFNGPEVENVAPGQDHSAAGNLLKSYVADTSHTYFTWDQTGTSSYTVRDGEREWDVDVVEYSIVLLLNPSISPAPTGYEYRLITNENSFPYAIKLFELASEGIEHLKDVLFTDSSWKNHILGIGASEDFVTGATDVSGDQITYDTVQGCIREVTYFNQGEEPWASMPYGTSNIRNSGCGPTGMSIIISTLTGENVTPEMTCNYAVTGGYYVSGKGTSHAFPKKAAEHWGLSCRRMRREQINEVVDGLNDGKLALVICAENTISGRNGHFIVLTGVTSEGYFTIADPGSRERTGNLYSPSTIQSYARNLADGSIWLIGN